MSRREFTSTASAASWQDGIVAGTGGLGAVLFGDAQQHSIVLSHEEFFLPLQAEVPRAAELSGVLGEVRDLVWAGDAVAAAELVEHAARESGVDRDIMPLDPFVPIACLTVSTAEPASPASYLRHGRFDTGAIDVSWTTTRGSISIELVPDRARGVITARLRSTSAETVELGIRLSSDRSTNVGNVTVIDFSDRVTAEFESSDTTLRCTVLPHVRPRADARPTGARAWANVLSGDASALPGHRMRARLAPGRDLVLELGADVQRDRPLPDVPAALNDAGATHERLFSRCRLDLATGVPDSVPIDEVLARARAGEPAFERAAVELAFAAGRSAIIAATGTLPPNLVGVWQGSWAPAWSGDYTINGNVQLGSTAAYYNTGTPELLASLFRLHLRFLDDYEDNARRLFGIGGYALPTHQSGHGRANHHSTTYPHIFWYGSGAWALRAAFDYFSSTGDAAFVTEVGWPFARKVMQFLLGITVTIDGRAHFLPSYSPENTPAGAANPLSVDATMDLAQARDAARIAAAFGRVVGDRSFEARWDDFAASLAPYRVDPESGALAEWAHPGVPEQLAHRHVSQLYPYWYDDGDDATDAAVDAAARRAVELKTQWRAEKPYGPPGHQEMAFGLSSIGIAAARLGDSRSAYRCALWLARDHFEANAISRHDQGSIFNVDGCGALPALVAEMLLSTVPGRIALLPALPEEWPRGSVEGLTGRGGIVVDELSWSPGEMVAVLRRRSGSVAAWPDPELAVTLPWSIQTPAGPTSTVRIRLDERPRRLRLHGARFDLDDDGTE